MRLQESICRCTAAALAFVAATADACGYTCDRGNETDCSQCADSIGADCCANPDSSWDSLREWNEPQACAAGWTVRQLPEDADWACRDAVQTGEGQYRYWRDGWMSDGDDNAGTIVAVVLVIEAAVFATAIAITCAVAKKQRFRTPLHGCCGDLGGCCVTCWCPCITWGQIAAFAWPDQLGDCWMGCCTYCCCSNLAQCMGMVSRQVVRERMAIQGDMCQDCCIHCCAHTCALCQEAREIELARASGQAFAPAPMSMGMQPLAPSMMTVTCPADVAPGQLINVQTPAGAVLQVQIPAGVGPGHSFQVPIPPTAQAAAPTLVPQVVPQVVPATVVQPADAPKAP